jgi:RNA polymerase sigma-B factor
MERDQAARDELLERHLPLARTLARRYMGAHEPFDDLFQVASVGLLKALNRFDVDRGSTFTSFAVPTILGELKRYFRDLGWSAHVPRGLQERALKIETEREKLATELGRSPTVSELAQAMELSVEEVVDGLEAGAAHHSASLDDPNVAGGDDHSGLRRRFGAEDGAYERVDHMATLESVMHELTVREQRALTLRFFEDMTQSEIARELGISQMQVSRILRRALARLTELTDEA